MPLIIMLVLTIVLAGVALYFILNMDKHFDKLKTEKDALAKELEEQKKNLAQAAPAASSAAGAQLTPEQLEKALQGSMDAIGDKLSGKLMAMMKDMQVSGGSVSPAQMQQFNKAAQEEAVDLSAIFSHTDVKSNIDNVGLEEKEVKGVDSALEKLKKMRQQKGK